MKDEEEEKEIDDDGSDPFARLLSCSTAHNAFCTVWRAKI